MPLNPAFYDRVETALHPFQTVLEKTQHLPSMRGLPLRMQEEDIRRDERLIGHLSRCAGNSAYYISVMLRSLYNDKLKDQIGGTYHKGLILCTDDASVRTMQHELFHFIYDQLLKETTRLDAVRLFELAKENEWLVDELQVNAEEYFAFGGEYYVHERPLWSPKKKLKEKDPQLHALIARILDGEEELLVNPSE